MQNLKLRLCAFLLAFTSTACQKTQLQQRPAPLPQDPFVEVYFNYEPSAEYTEFYRQQTRAGDNLEQQIIDAIASAQFTVDVAVQELHLPKIAQALLERQTAGVRVRVILENTYSRPWSTFTTTEVSLLPQRERDRHHEFRQLIDRNQDGQLDLGEINEGDAMVILRQGKVPWIDDTADGSAGSDLMHHKFVVVDGRILIVTSANFTASDIHGDFATPSSLGNANNLLKIDSPELATLFTQEFNLMWGDGPNVLPDSKFGLKKPWRPAQQVQLGSSTIKVQFSPTSPTLPWSQSSNGLIGSLLKSATHSVNLALFVFSDQHLANILETRHQQGVQVRAVIDPTFAYRSYSEGLDMMGVRLLARSCKYEIDNHPWQNAIATVGVPQLLKGDLLHHKFGIVDKHSVIKGSHNWSEAANTGNDEALLLIHSPTVAAHYVREFERLYANARLGVPASLQKKIQAQQQQCPHQSASRPSQLGASNLITSNSSKESSQAGQKVNLNTASRKELEALPGVGAKLAQRIIQARQQKLFRSVKDLDRVPGVGPSLLEKLSDRVTW